MAWTMPSPHLGTLRWPLLPVVERRPQMLPVAVALLPGHLLSRPTWCHPGGSAFASNLVKRDALSLIHI
eukprot:15083689-Alexandrium_andersonii.AAC.1